MADLTARQDHWTDYLPQSWQHNINTSPILNALGRALNKPTPNLERAALDTYGTPDQKAEADRQWLLQKAQGPSWLERNPTAADGLNKLGMLANFVGPGVKLPGVPKTPGRYAMEYPGGRIDYKDVDAGGVHISGIYTNPEARGQGNARQALQELITAADAAKRPLSLEISPGAPGVDPARLRQWYEGLGFQGPDFAMTRPPPQPGIRAYHGSPHDFDRFDINKIGTGEGAQAYGRGLYFAEKEAVAKNYRDRLGGSLPSKFDTEQEALAAAGQGGRVQRFVTGGFGAINRKGEYVKQDPGRMYEVRINADPEQFLDWDKPLAQQPEAVRRAVEGLPQTEMRGSNGLNTPVLDREGDAFYHALAEAVGTPFDPKFPRRPERLDHNRATQLLRDAGIPGIKYLDQVSRGKAEGSRNYVVFDDKLIEILRKYGLLPPVVAGTAATLNQEQPQQ